MANDHDWAVFLAPADPQGRAHLANEVYYYERNNGITTWVRPFDYVEPDIGSSFEAVLSVGKQWQQEETERRLQLARTRAKSDRPVQQNSIPGTEWMRVATEQGRTYYYNNVTRVSQWTRPSELESRDEEVVEEDGTEMNADDAEWMLAQMSDNEDDEIEDSGNDAEDLEPTQQSEEAGDVDMSKDGRIAQFKALLQEIGVNPFGTWESQSSRFASDRRFALVTADAERQDLFDAACKEVAAARSKRSLATDRHSSTLEAPPSALHPFDQLLREHVTKKTSFARFCQKHLKDPRFTSLKTSREREKMFQRHMETIA